ncbi:MAG: AAA family ATPase, partial [Chloroflexota bacterium]|nr:AAA family ATPase [Chloroflexota bacterium]
MARTGRSTTAVAPYVARENELGRLVRRLDAAHYGRGGLAIVRGPGGSGTTRTAHELAARADRLGVLVLWGRFFEGTSSRPYGGLADALEGYVLDLDRESVTRDVGADAAPLARLAPRLATALAELTPAAPLEARDETLRLQAAVLDWLTRATARQPLLLVLDDVQWADADSLRLLDRLSHAGRDMPLLIVATQASFPLADELAVDAYADELRRRLEVESAEVVELAGLDEAATAAVLAGLTDEPIGRSVVQLVHQASGGQPLFARELFQHLLEENRIPGADGKELPAPDELPEALEQLVAWRLARLGPEVRSALIALAAFHDGASPDIVAQVSGSSRGRVVEFLEAGLRTGLCRLSGHGQRY